MMMEAGTLPWRLFGWQ